MNTADKDALHAAIMNLPVSRTMPDELGVAQRTWYTLGHRDARHAAADLVASHPAEMVDTEVQTAHPVDGLPCKDLQTALPRWIPVSESLPHVFDQVLCCCDSTTGPRVVQALMSYDGTQDGTARWTYEFGRHRYTGVVTHWAALPLPPGEAAEAAPSGGKAPAVGVGSPVSTAMEVLTAVTQDATKPIPEPWENAAAYEAWLLRRWPDNATARAIYHSEMNTRAAFVAGAEWDRAKALVSAQGAAR